MKSTNFLTEVFQDFSNVSIRKENKDFYKIDTLVYYLADKEKSIIRANDIIEVDIRSAFPTICGFLFSEEKEFLSRLDDLKDKKLERNIFISTTLKGTEHLKQLNLISKMIISAVVMDADPAAKILELKKDGISYVGKDISRGKLFKKYTQMGFQIRRTPFKKYIRYQRTSYFLDENDEMTIKGVFKDRPPLILETTEKILREDQIEPSFLNKIYSGKFFEIIRRNALDELFSQYYLCEGNKYLTDQFRYERVKYIPKMTNLRPKNYLKLFVYPLLLD